MVVGRFFWFWVLGNLIICLMMVDGRLLRCSGLGGGGGILLWFYGIL